MVVLPNPRDDGTSKIIQRLVPKGKMRKVLCLFRISLLNFSLEVKGARPSNVSVSLENGFEETPTLLINLYDRGARNCERGHIIVQCPAAPVRYALPRNDIADSGEPFESYPSSSKNLFSQKHKFIQRRPFLNPAWKLWRGGKPFKATFICVLLY